MAGRPIRLGNAAGELNVGLENLVEFLGTKGIDIHKNPNTKLTQENYELLCNEFAADQVLKEKSKGVSNHREKRESLSIEDSKVPESNVQNVETEAAIEEPKPVVAVEQEIPAVKVPEKDVKIVGKIDLEALNQKTKPEKKPKEKPVEASKETEEKVKPAGTPPVEIIETIKVERKKISEFALGAASGRSVLSIRKCSTGQ